MRNISFSLTAGAFLDGTKEVTRRLGWNPDRTPQGTKLMAVNKCQGLKKGEQIKYGPIVVLSNVPEPLEDIVIRPNRYGPQAAPQLVRTEVQREGFPAWSSDPEKFVEFFIRANPRTPQGERTTRKTLVNRIVFRRIT